VGESTYSAIKIPGINGETTEGYTPSGSPTSVSPCSISIRSIQRPSSNPYKHLDRLQDTNGDKGNFFETTVVNYTQSTSMNGSWDF
jgi:hypothetical protein